MTISKPLSLASRILALTAFVASAGLANTVEYSTTGVFSNGAGFNTTNNTAAFTNATGSYLKFTGMPDTTVFPTTAQFAVSQVGKFKSSVVANDTLTAHGTFTLTVNQVLPTAGAASAASNSFTGNITADSNGAPFNGLTITFASPTITIGDVTYTLMNLGSANELVLANGPRGTTATADISIAVTTNNHTPEPAFYGLTGMGLAGLFTVVALRRRTV